MNNTDTLLGPNAETRVSHCCFFKSSFLWNCFLFWDCRHGDVPLWLGTALLSCLRAGTAWELYPDLVEGLTQSCCVQGTNALHCSYLSLRECASTRHILKNMYHRIQSGNWTRDLSISRRPLCNLSYRAWTGWLSNVESIDKWLNQQKNSFTRFQRLFLTQIRYDLSYFQTCLYDQTQEKYWKTYCD